MIGVRLTAVRGVPAAVGAAIGGVALKRRRRDGLCVGGGRGRARVGLRRVLRGESEVQAAILGAEAGLAEGTGELVLVAHQAQQGFGPFDGEGDGGRGAGRAVDHDLDLAEFAGV